MNVEAFKDIYISKVVMSDIHNILNICFQSEQMKTSEGLPVKAKSYLTFSTWWIIELPQIMSTRNVTETSEASVHLNKCSFLLLHSICPASIFSKLKSGFLRFLNLRCVVAAVYLLYFQCGPRAEAQHTHTMKLPFNDYGYYYDDDPHFISASWIRANFRLRLGFQSHCYPEHNEITTQQKILLFFSQNSKWKHCSAFQITFLQPCACGPSTRMLYYLTKVPSPPKERSVSLKHYREHAGESPICLQSTRWDLSSLSTGLLDWDK